MTYEKETKYYKRQKLTQNRCYKLVLKNKWWRV